jgi:hypothetical protein
LLNFLILFLFASLPNQPFQPASAPFQTPLTTWMSNPSIVTHPAVAGGGIGFGSITNPGTDATDSLSLKP